VNSVPCDVAVAGLLDRDRAGAADRLDETGAPVSKAGIGEDLVAVGEPIVGGLMGALVMSVYLLPSL